MPELPDFKAPDAREQYDNYWGNLPDDFYKDPEALQEALQVLWMGVDQWGKDVMPAKGWGTHDTETDVDNHTDTGSKNMVKAIQAALGIANPDGIFGNKTRDLLSLVNWGGQGTRVGQRILNQLLGLNQRICDNYHNGLVNIDLKNIKGKNVISLMDQFAARRLYILDKRAKELKINYNLIDLFRTKAQQTIYYNNWKAGKMPWTNVVALPGKGPHEAGIAFDVDAAGLGDNFEQFKNLAEQCGFNWQGPGDKAHFGMPFYTSRENQVYSAQQAYNSIGL